VSEVHRPRIDIHLDDCLDYRPVLGGTHHACGRGQEKEMTKSVWMTCSGQHERTSINARQEFAEGIMNAYRVREERSSERSERLGFSFSLFRHEIKLALHDMNLF
jgi:hypothetical protein